MYLAISLLSRTSGDDRIFSQGGAWIIERGGHILFILFIINNYYKHKTSCFKTSSSTLITFRLA